MNAKAVGFEVYNFNETLLFILAIIMISACGTEFLGNAINHCCIPWGLFLDFVMSFA
jgi:hypothetical protein